MQPFYAKNECLPARALLCFAASYQLYQSGHAWPHGQDEIFRLAMICATKRCSTPGRQWYRCGG